MGMPAAIHHKANNKHIQKSERNGNQAVSTETRRQDECEHTSVLNCLYKIGDQES